MFTRNCVGAQLCFLFLVIQWLNEILCLQLQPELRQEQLILEPIPLPLFALDAGAVRVGGSGDTDTPYGHEAAAAAAGATTAGLLGLHQDSSQFQVLSRFSFIHNYLWCVKYGNALSRYRSHLIIIGNGS